MRWLIRIFSCLFLLAAALPALALNVEEPMENPSQEARAQALFYDIRCMVCQGESIADSPAAVAGDVRRLVRQLLREGKSDEAIVQILVNAYGEAVLMRPPFKRSTWVLWFGPLVVLLLGGAFALHYFYRHKMLPRP